MALSESVETNSDFKIGDIPSESKAVCAEWKEARDGHPSHCEAIDMEAAMRFWDGIAADYRGGERKEMIAAVLGTLDRMGAIEGSVLDVGSGPGTFSLPFAAKAERVVALDSSANMLGCLESKATEMGLSNVCTVQIDWNEFAPEERYDLVFSSLCPGANSPASILRMEALSKGKCAYVSSMNNDRAMNQDIWKRLGRDYSYRGYDTNFPYRFLMSMGRRPFFLEMSWVHSMELDASELIEREVRRFGMYPSFDEVEVREAVRGAVHDRYGAGSISEETVLRAGLLVWDAGDVNTPKRLGHR